jgi:hypothetical protein
MANQAPDVHLDSRQAGGAGGGSSLDDKEMMIKTEPRVFLTTPHYDGYPIVLVRLEALDIERARELITESWRLRAPKALLKKSPKRR